MKRKEKGDASTHILAFSIPARIHDILVRATDFQERDLVARGHGHQLLYFDCFPLDTYFQNNLYYSNVFNALKFEFDTTISLLISIQ